LDKSNINHRNDALDHARSARNKMSMKIDRSAIATIAPALKRARFPILSVALTYLVSVITGMVMVHLGNPFALRTRDNLIYRVYNSNDPTITALQNNRPLQAALSDFSQNLILGGIPSTVGGLGVVFPYPEAAYRGWIGGIVSVDDDHVSRFAQPGKAVYYLVTLILQLIPYSLAGGAGVHLGVAYFRLHSGRQKVRWWSMPKDAVLDVVRIYLLIVPLFLIASLWEFLLA
jgi:hypothetical protein